MSRDEDRQIHAVLSDGSEVVRYNRAGKWRVEGYHKRRLISLSTAVALAVETSWTGGRIFYGRPGGRTFDAHVKTALASHPSAHTQEGDRRGPVEIDKHNPSPSAENDRTPHTHGGTDAPECTPYGTRCRSAEKDARCSRCDEVVGAVVIEGGRATIRLSTSSHGDTLPIACPRVTPPRASADE